MVFFIENWCSTTPRSRASPRTRSRRRARPAWFGLPRPQDGVGVGACRVERGARGQDEHHGLERAVGRRRRAGRHARGVVGHHPADGAGALAGRVRPQAPAVRGERGVDPPQHRTRLAPDTGAAVEDLDVGEVPAHVDEHAVAGRLPGQRRAARPERHRGARRAGRGEDRGHLRRRRCRDHRLAGRGGSARRRARGAPGRSPPCSVRPGRQAVASAARSACGRGWRPRAAFVVVVISKPLSRSGRPCARRLHTRRMPPAGRYAQRLAESHARKHCAIRR